MRSESGPIRPRRNMAVACLSVFSILIIRVVNALVVPEVLSTGLVQSAGLKLIYGSLPVAGVQTRKPDPSFVTLTEQTTSRPKDHTDSVDSAAFAPTWPSTIRPIYRASSMQNRRPFKLRAEEWSFLLSNIRYRFSVILNESKPPDASATIATAVSLATTFTEMGKGVPARIDIQTNRYFFLQLSTRQCERSGMQLLPALVPIRSGFINHEDHI